VVLSIIAAQFRVAALRRTALKAETGAHSTAIVAQSTTEVPRRIAAPTPTVARIRRVSAAIAAPTAQQ